MSCGNQAVLCQKIDDNVRARVLHLKKREHSILKVFNIIFNISSEISLYSKIEDTCILVMCSEFWHLVHIAFRNDKENLFSLSFSFKVTWQGKSSEPGAQVIFTRCHPLVCQVDMVAEWPFTLFTSTVTKIHRSSSSLCKMM